VKDAEEVERMNYLEFIAGVVSHIPDKGQSLCAIRAFTPTPTGGRLRRFRGKKIPGRFRGQQP